MGACAGAAARVWALTERHAVLLGEGKLLAHDLGVDVDLVGDADGGDLGAVVSQLLEPRREVLVRRLARHVKAQDARVRLVVVGGVHRVEALLPGGVPEVDLDRLAVDLRVVAEERERVRGEHARLIVLHLKSAQTGRPRTRTHENDELSVRAGERINKRREGGREREAVERLVADAPRTARPASICPPQSPRGGSP